MFAQLGSEIPLEALIPGVIVQSGNDAAIVLAEGIAGSEANFARMMTERARELGFTVSTFRNATGLPDEEQKVTMKEMVGLARHIWREYPDFYQYYSVPDYEWNGITQRNRNPLLRMNVGADGLKTGYIEASGYALVASAERDGMRVFLAISGLESERERAEEARKLIEWGMRAFERVPLYDEGEIVGAARIYGGGQASVGLTSPEPIAMLLPVAGRDR
ncbi:MAG: D-alanyl-D-alanine carboxypeptidase, partial [Leptolyngbya sp. SIO4C5]|nr:D-alanyl-D-alanine carboxypeptidase [Leptolyngbya sp. SIO4C5]